MLRLVLTGQAAKMSGLVNVTSEYESKDVHFIWQYSSMYCTMYACMYQLI